MASVEKCKSRQIANTLRRRRIALNDRHAVEPDVASKHVLIDIPQLADLRKVHGIDPMVSDLTLTERRLAAFVLSALAACGVAMVIGGRGDPPSLFRHSPETI